MKYWFCFLSRDTIYAKGAKSEEEAVEELEKAIGIFYNKKTFAKGIIYNDKGLEKEFLISDDFKKLIK